MRARSLRDVVEDGEGRGPGHMRTQLAIGLSKGAGTLTQRRGRGWRRLCRFCSAVFVCFLTMCMLFELLEFAEFQICFVNLLFFTLSDFFCF